MSLKLASRNDDIHRLVEKGYAIAIDGAHLIVRDIPYLDNECNLQWGAFVSKLIFVDQERVQQDDHQIYFTGTAPYNIDGSFVSGLSGGPHVIALSEASKDVVVQRSFSNKRVVNGQKIGYTDFFEKIENYVALVAGPAMNKYGASPLTEVPLARAYSGSSTSICELIWSMRSRPPGWVDIHAGGEPLPEAAIFCHSATPARGS